MNFPCRARDLFPVDLGIDLKAMQPEIIQCKRRFQQDLWNTICNRVLQEQSGWKKGEGKGGGGSGGGGSGSKESKSEEKGEESGGGGGEESKGSEEKPEGSDEAPKEDEEAKPEGEGEAEGEGDNDNNAMWSNRSNSRRMQQERDRRSRRQLQQQRPPPAPKLQKQQQQQQQQYAPRHQYQQRPGFSGVQQRQEAFYLTRQQLPLPRQYGFGGAVGGGELSSFLRRIQPLEGVLDWRGSSGASRGRVSGPTGPPINGSSARVLPPVLAHVNPTAATSRSYSATSRREILGFEDVSNEAASVDASEACQDAQILQSNSVNGARNFNYVSDGDSASFNMNNAAQDRATGSTDGATREFVPLMVGNWWACGGQRSLQL